MHFSCWAGRWYFSLPIILILAVPFIIIIALIGVVPVKFFEFEFSPLFQSNFSLLLFFFNLSVVIISDILTSWFVILICRGFVIHDLDRVFIYRPDLDGFAWKYRKSSFIFADEIFSSDFYYWSPGVFLSPLASASFHFLPLSFWDLQIRVLKFGIRED